jgi:hypothetical protein
MKKEELVKLGLTEEDAEKVAKASEEELKGFVPKARFDEVNEAKKHAEESVKERDKQIEGLKTSAGDAEKLKEQIEQLQQDNKAKDSLHASEIKKLKIDNAVDSALMTAKAKNLKAVRALLDLDKAELSEDGTVKGLAEQIEALSKADDSKFLFESSGKPNIKGAKTGEDGSDGNGGKPDLSKMNYDEICQYLAENPDAEI